MWNQAIVRKLRSYWNCMELFLSFSFYETGILQSSNIFISPYEVYICICYIIVTRDKGIPTTIALYIKCSIIFVPFDSILSKFRLISNKRKNKQHVRQWGRGESVRHVQDRGLLNNIRQSARSGRFGKYWLVSTLSMKTGRHFQVRFKIIIKSIRYI